MPFNPATWRTDSGKAFHGRSTDLQQVDAALRQYELGKSAQTLKALTRAILAWQATKVPWTASIRRDAMVQLINYVKAEAVTRFTDGDQEIFSYVKCEPDMQILTTNPRRLMGMRPIYVSGEATDCVATFRLGWSSGDPTYDYGPIAVPNIFAAQEKFSLASANRGPGMQAISILMHTDVTNLTTAPMILNKLYRLGGASMMTTGQLSGCTFIVREDQGHLECTHLKPNGFGGDGVPLQNHIEGLNLGPDVAIYGRKDYPNPNGGGEVRVSVIGRRGAHGWEIFAQRYIHGTSIVQGTDRIWPPEG